MKKLIYTFKSFPYIENLNSNFGPVFVLDKLKRDIEIFCDKAKAEKPQMILGVARSTAKYSTIEKFAINDFQGRGQVFKRAEKLIELTVLDNLVKKGFKVRKKPTNTFCNYSMFKIAWFLKKNKITTPFVFVHVSKGDIERIKIKL